MMIDRQAIVIAAVKGRYTSKPRPWLVIQSDAFQTTDSVTICMITQILIPNASLLRIDVAPSRENGLLQPSQIQIEKILTVKRSDVVRLSGRLENWHMGRVDEALRFFLGV